MSILKPVSLAASLAFCPSLPIARDSCESGTTTKASLFSGSAKTDTTFEGLSAFSIKIAGLSLQLIMSIFSSCNSSTTAFTLAPLIPTHAPTASTFSSFDHTAIFVLEPASLAMLLISTVPS